MTLRAGRFELVQRLAGGVSGEVYRGRDPDGHDVAVKVLKPGPRVLDRLFRQEVAFLAELDHPHVLPVLDAGRLSAPLPDGGAGEGARWMALPFCGGGTVDAHPPDSFDALTTMLQQVLLALGHCHARGILHRDVKSENLLLDAHGRVLLADFGLGARWGAGAVRRPQRGGTPVYVAPEQGAGQWWAEGPATDLHAVGVLGWSLAAGRLPMLRRSTDKDLALGAARRLPRLRATFPVPEGFSDWCRKLAHPDAAQRPALAALALAELRALGGPTFRPRPRSRPGTPGLGVAGLRRLPVRGRSAERRALARMVSRVRGRPPRALVLEGAQGSGKSTLARWLAERASEEGLAWVHRVDAAGGAARDGLDEAVAQALGVQRATRAEAMERLGAEAPLEILWPTQPMPPALRRARTREVMVQRAGSLPCLVWIDDAEEAVEALRFVQAWLESGESGVLLVTVDDRVDDPQVAALLEAILAHPLSRRVEVPPLSDDDVEALVDALLPLQPALRSDVIARSQGRPAIARQLVCDWIERGLLGEARDGHFLAETDGRGIPLDLQGIWRRRLEGLLDGKPLAWRPALWLAAALGRSSELVRWQAACGHFGVEADEALVEHLQGARVLALEGDHLRFVQVRPFRLLEHDALRERAVLEAAVAAMDGGGDVEQRLKLLQALGDTRAWVRATLEAAHAQGFRDVERALGWYRQAGEAAVSLGPDGIDERRDALRGYSRCAYVLQLPEELEAAIEGCEGLVAAGDSRGVVLAHRARAYLASVRARPDEAAKHLEAGVAAGVPGDDVSASMAGELACQYLEVGRCREAFDLLGGVEASERPALRHWLALLRLEAQVGLGQSTQALLGGEALKAEVEADVDNPVQIAQLHGVMALALQDLGHLREALEVLDHSIAVRRSTGLPAPVSTVVRAGLLLQLDDIEGARATLQGQVEGSEARAFELMRLAVEARTEPSEGLGRAVLRWLEVADPRQHTTTFRALETVGDALRTLHPEAARACWARARDGWGLLGRSRRRDRIARKLEASP